MHKLDNDLINYLQKRFPRCPICRSIWRWMLNKSGANLWYAKIYLCSHHWGCKCSGASCLLTHWGRVIICLSKLNIIVSDSGLSPGLCQAIIWTNAEILLIGPLGTNFSENFKKMRLKVSSAKRRPFCLCLNVLTDWGLNNMTTISHINKINEVSYQNILVYSYLDSDNTSMG